jgi:hypothetical protein
LEGACWILFPCFTEHQQFSRFSDEGAAQSYREKESDKYVLAIPDQRQIDQCLGTAHIFSEIHLAGQCHLASTTRK